MKVYVSGPLTNLREEGQKSVKRLYERIEDICVEYGVHCYLPHKKSDPRKHSDLSSAEVYKMDEKEVISSDLIVAYAGYPSHGVGSEIQLANQKDIPVLLLIEERKSISRMLDGNPSIEGRIVFKNLKDLEYKFKASLKRYIKNASEESLEKVASEYDIPYRQYCQLKQVCAKGEKPISTEEWKKIFGSVTKMEKSIKSGQRKLSDF